MTEFARTQLERKCKSKDSSTDEHKLRFDNNSRTKFWEIGHYFCGEGDFNITSDILWNTVHDARKMTITDRAKRYSRTDWLSKQSLCYEDRESVELSSIVVADGLAYAFNLDEELFDKTT